MEFVEFDTKLGFGITFPCRTTILPLSGNRSLVISPGLNLPIEKLKTFDEVLFAAPNAFHHLFIKKALRAFPEAPVFATRGVAKKQPELKEQLRPMEELQKLLGEEVLILPIQGNKLLDEVVFWHPSSKTLVVTDLFFNMNEPMPRARRWVLKLVSCHNKIAQSKAIKWTTKNKDSYKASIQKLAELGAETMVVGHGDPIRGQKLVRETLQSLL